MLHAEPAKKASPSPAPAKKAGTSPAPAKKAGTSPAPAKKAAASPPAAAKPATSAPAPKPAAPSGPIVTIKGVQVRTTKKRACSACTAGPLADVATAKLSQGCRARNAAGRFNLRETPAFCSVQLHHTLHFLASIACIMHTCAHTYTCTYTSARLHTYAYTHA
jgi:hypothetical protein